MTTKRLRPAKVLEEKEEKEEEGAAPKKRGRPAKVVEEKKEESIAPKKRGGPAASKEIDAEPTLKKRGRPSKAAVTEEAEAYAGPAPKRRGRPAKPQVKTPSRPLKTDAVAESDDAAMPKKRGRPPKEADAPDPAPAAKRARGRPKKDAIAAPARYVPGAATEAIKAVAQQIEQRLGTVDLDATASRGYWLMKAEPESRMETTASGKRVDVRFSIDDLASKTAPEPWDGIRNYVARNNIRAMEVGDLAFFAESNTKTPGIVGIMEIVGDARPDPSQFDADSAYYDAKAVTSQPKWDQVLVAFRRKFERKIAAAELKTYAGPGGPLEALQMFRTSRLSVSRVDKDEWDFIMSLIDGEEVTAAAGNAQQGQKKKAGRPPSTPTAAGRKRKAAPATEPVRKSGSESAAGSPAANGDGEVEAGEAFALQVQSPTLLADATTAAPPPVTSVEVDGLTTGATRSFLGKISEGIVSVLASPGRAMSRALSATPGPEGGLEAAVREGRVVDGVLGVTVEEDEGVEV